MMKQKYLAMCLSCFMPFVMGQENSNMPHYIVGSDANYPPFQLRDGRGRTIGFEPELIKRIGEVEGFTVDVVYYPRSEWHKVLEEGKVDIFASALGIYPDRLEIAEMSDPTLDFYDAVYILDTPKNKNIQKMSDFVNKKFAAISGIDSTSKFVKTLNDGSNTLDVQDSVFLALREVWAGNADAVTNNNRLFQYYGKKYPKFKYRLIPFEPTEVKSLGFAFKKGRTDLRDKVNEGLKKVKADGSFRKIFEHWFGVELN